MDTMIPPPDGLDINIGGLMMRTIWTLWAITFIVVMLRLYTQWKVTAQLGLGDAMMFCSLVCATAMVSVLTVQHHFGLGRRFFYLDAHQKVEALKFNFIGQPLGIMAPAFGRSASAIMMLQLFGTTTNRRRILWFVFWQSLAVNMITLILIFVQCKDIRTLWDPIRHPGHCWSPTVQEYTGFAQGAVNSATDLFLTVLPISIFWTLKIGLHLKIGLGFLLGMSAFAFVASVIKTVELQSIGDRGDFTFGTVSFFTWVVVEFTLVDIAASLPLMLPLVRKYIKTPTTQFTHHPKTPSKANTLVTFGRIPSRTKKPDADIESNAYNSSEENILSNTGGQDCLGRNISSASRISGANGAIVKKTSFDVAFRTVNLEARVTNGGNERDEMWLMKELPKIPWEAERVYNR